ncbi:glycine radical enzyme, YjjI family [Edwardsiella tarda]|nr:glycine radical enzyme, YjjI family [Edwardsiella tarda]
MSEIIDSTLRQRGMAIACDPHLSPEQKRHFLALEAENHLPYPPLPDDARQALEEGVICDMFEGHAPYKPRYVLPDYARFLAQGSTWLELEPAQDFDDALAMLVILYHHVPSVTSMPVFFGAFRSTITTVCWNFNRKRIIYPYKTILALSGSHFSRCLYACQPGAVG